MARSSEGMVVFCAWGVIEQFQSAVVTEAIACVEGLKVAMNLDLGNLIFETYCNSLIKIFDPGSVDRSPASFMAKYFHRLKHEHIAVKFLYVNRLANGVAHNLAQWGRREWSDGVLFDQVPTCMLELVEHDCNKSVMSE